MAKKRVNLIISLTIGLAIFSIFLWKTGPESINLILKNMNFKYFLAYLFFTTVTLFPITLRWRVILKAYKKEIPFLTLFKQTIAGFAVSYVTPSVRLGGEPLRAYMLKKECNVNLKTGATTIILDKFVELTGSIIFGIAGLALLTAIPGVPFFTKIFLAFLLILTLFGLFILYYRTLKNKESFSYLFKLLRFYKIKKIKNFVYVLREIELKMAKFFQNHKKEFIASFFYYFLYGFLIILEFKFLLLSFGIRATITEIILSLTVLGIVNFIPVPAALGFLEAGQSGLFFLLKKQGSIGFALSLIIRLRNLLFVAIGFSLISYFTGKQIENRKLRE